MCSVDGCGGRKAFLVCEKNLSMVDPDQINFRFGILSITGLSLRRANVVSLILQFLTPDMVGCIATTLGFDRNSVRYQRRCAGAAGVETDCQYPEGKVGCIGRAMSATFFLTWRAPRAR